MENSAKSEKASQKPKANIVSRIIGWSIGLAVTAVMVVVLYFSVPPAYAEAKVWRAGHFAAAGAGAFAAEDWEAAIEFYQLASQLNPKGQEYRRQTARASEKISVARANELWNGIIRRSGVTLQERQDYVDFLLRIGRLDIAAEQMTYLMMTKPPPPRSLVLASDLFRLKGDREMAVIVGKRALVGAPEDAEIQFKLGSLLATEDTSKDRLDGRRLLWDLAKRTNSMRFQAWKALVATGDLNPGEADEMLKWIREAGRETEDLTLVGDLKIIAQPSSKETVIRSVVSSLTSTNTETLSEVAAWLNAKSAHDEALSLLPLEATGTNLTLLSIHIDSLIGLKRWNTVEQVLVRTNSPLDPVVADCVRAHMAAKQGEAKRADEIWSRLVTATTNNPLKARIVAVESERMGRKDVALRAYSAFLNDDRFGREANRQTYRIARSLSQFELARQCAVRLARVTDASGRSDPSAVASMIYLNLLLKQQQRQALESATALSRLHPDQPVFTVLTAFGYLRNGEPKRAMALIDEIKSQVNILPPQWRAVAAAVMKANDRVSEYTRLRASLDDSGLNREEMKLILN